MNMHALVYLYHCSADLLHLLVPHLVFYRCTLSTRNDVRRRRKHYISDWTDAFQKKRQVIPAVLFLYFACLAPAVSFGTISSEITNGSIGVVEFLLSSGVSGMVSFEASTIFIQPHDLIDQSLYILFLAVLHFIRTTNGISSTHWAHACIHIGTISVLQYQESPFFSGLCLGGVVDECFYDNSWTLRF